MKTTRTWVCTAGVLLAVSAALAQPPGGRPNWRDEPPSEGFWPTQRMIDIAIERMLREMSRDYSFDEDQVGNTRELLHERLPAWLQDNRPELQSLLNEYMEIMMGLDPPEPQEMAVWAQRALPVVEDFGSLLEQTTDDMRSYLTDDQQVLLDGQMAAMRVGMGYMQQRLETWKGGGYDRFEDWPHGQAYRDRQREKERILRDEAARARDDAMGLAPGTPTSPQTPSGGEAAENAPGRATPAQPAAKDEWMEYVENFIRRYQLDDAQQNSARKFLRDQQELRDKYLRDKLPKIKLIEEQLNGAKTDDERERVRVELTRLNQPIERYFQRLKERLDTLPTRKQRGAAAQADLATQAKKENPEKAKRAAESQPPPKPEREPESKPGS